MRVSVYFNLHRKLFSVRAEDGPEKGRVIAHADALGLHFCKLIVGQAGNAKVRREGRKNVHAFIKGDLAYLKGSLTLAGERAFQTYKKAGQDTEASTLATFNSLDLTRFQTATREGGVPFGYDPYKNTSFINRTTGQAISTAATVSISRAGAFALAPE